MPLQNGPHITNFLTNSDRKVQKCHQVNYLSTSSSCAVFFDPYRFRTMRIHTACQYQGDNIIEIMRLDNEGFELVFLWCSNPVASWSPSMAATGGVLELFNNPILSTLVILSIYQFRMMLSLS